MAGNDAAPWRACYSDEPLSDMTSLLNIARARVYACMRLMGIDDPQTRRAQTAMIQLLSMTQAQVLPDMSVRPLDAATLTDELSQAYILKSPRDGATAFLCRTLSRGVTFENGCQSVENLAHTHTHVYIYMYVGR